MDQKEKERQTMKKMRQKLISNLGTAFMFLTAVSFVWGSNGCWFYFYEPEKPEGAEKVTRKELMNLVHKK